MKSLKLAIIYGFLVWLVPFVVSVIIFPIHDTNRPLFESIMPVAGVSIAVFLSAAYFRKVGKDFVVEGLKLGVLWFVISILIDSLMFFGGPLQMTVPEYTADIGVTYLTIPVITIGTGFLLEKRKSS